MLECFDLFVYFFLWKSVCHIKDNTERVDFSLTLWPILARRCKKKKDSLTEIKESWIANQIYVKQQL